MVKTDQGGLCREEKLADPGNDYLYSMPTFSEKERDFFGEINIIQDSPWRGP